MALLAWWSAAEAKLITNHEKINELSDFVQMLQTVPVSSNFEVIIMFPGRLDIYSLVIEVYLYYEVKSLRSLGAALASKKLKGALKSQIAGQLSDDF